MSLHDMDSRTGKKSVAYLRMWSEAVLGCIRSGITERNAIVEALADRRLPVKSSRASEVHMTLMRLQKVGRVKCGDRVHWEAVVRG